VVNGKLDFSPEVKDFASQDFAWWAESDYVGDRPSLPSYIQRRQHFINLFTWPSSSSSPTAK